MSAAVTQHRSRPLLGTLVEIQGAHASPGQLTRAIDRAFLAITRVHDRMSYHAPESDVSRLNRFAAQRPVQVDGWTWTVLRHAGTISRRSGGCFDVTVAPRLARWGLLPRSRAQVSPTASWRDIRLLSGRRVRFLTPLAIDLGGIAKGYAVDRAIAILRAAGVRHALVNAGGDLRSIGSFAHPLQVRHPAKPGVFLPVAPVRNIALATSALTFTARRWRGRQVGALVDARSGAACGHGLSVSVRAPSAWLADALTKVVVADPAGAASVLRHYRAQAMVFTSDASLTASLNRAK